MTKAVPTKKFEVTQRFCHVVESFLQSRLDLMIFQRERKGCLAACFKDGLLLNGQERCRPPPPTTDSECCDLFLRHGHSYAYLMRCGHPFSGKEITARSF
ncbi:hypothetical protein JTE90_024351 [Oedothorax gibbosus]|uniref:Uncharacterized protein n=1 Tax=Oedothorax gibbosus TaxID=931172 RepID=A0AAV6W142_9ARAC|nr:hypothetical protein JTE90_024351 [Oedothorax gibbosus]